MTRWLNREGVAAHLSVHVDALPRLMREGRIPKPNYALGSRSPRWDIQALDAAILGDVASTDPGEAVNALIEKMRAKARKKDGAACPR